MASDASVDALAKQVRALEAALKAAAASTKGASDGIAKTGENADKAKAKATEFEKALEKIGKAAGISSTLTNAMGAAMGNLASGAVTAGVGAVIDFARHIPEGTANAERHTEALTALGSQYGQVQQATNGAVTAEQAFALQQRFAQEGLHLSGEELAAVTARARNFGRAMGIDTTAAIERLGTQLATGGDELRSFGITVTTSGTKTDKFRQAIGQLVEQHRHTPPATLSAREAHEQYEHAVENASNAIDSFLSKGVGLTQFFSNLADLINDVNDGTRTMGEVLTDVANGRLFGNAGQSTSADASNAYGSALDELRRAGVNTAAYPMPGQMALASEGERASVMRIIQRDLDRARARASGGSGAGATGRDLFGTGGAMPALSIGTDAPGGVDTGTGAGAIATILGDAATRRGRESAAAARAAAAERQRLERERRDRAARERAAALAPNVNLGGAQSEFREAQAAARADGLGGAVGLGAVDAATERMNRLRSAAGETGSRRGENEEARLRRVAAAITALTAEVQTRKTAELALNDALMAAAAAEGERRKAMDEAIRSQGDEARHTRAETVQIAADIQQAMRDIEATADHSARGDYVRRQQRRQDLEEQRTAVVALLHETEARIEQAQREHAAQAELNRLMTERLGLMRLQAQLSTEVRASQQEDAAATNEFKDAMKASLGEVADAIGGAALAAIDGSKTFDQALGESLRAVLKNIAQESIPQVLKNLALGFSTGSPTYFQAAAMWGAAGLAAGAAYAVTKPSAPAAAPHAATGSRDAASGRSAHDGASGANSVLALSVTVNGALFNDGVVEGVARGVQAAQARGLLPMTQTLGSWS